MSEGHSPTGTTRGSPEREISFKDSSLGHGHTGQADVLESGLLSLDMSGSEKFRGIDWNNLNPDVAKMLVDSQFRAEAQQREHEFRMKELEMKFNQDRLHAENRQLEFEMQRQASVDQMGSFPSEELKGLRLPKFEEGQDIDVFLRTFERLASAQSWPRGQWAIKLASVLTGKARDAFVRIPAEESNDYDKVRRAILRRYELTSEAYRLKFRTTRKEREDTYEEWRVILQGFAERWMETCEVTYTYEGLKDLMLIEQMLESSPPYMQSWLREQKPKTSKEVAELADHYVESHKPKSLSNGILNRKQEWKRDSYMDKNSYRGAQARVPFRDYSSVVCYRCNKKGHMASKCYSQDWQ